MLSRRDLIVDDVVELELPAGGVAQHHVARAVGVEVAEARDLKIQPDRAQVRRRRDGIVANIHGCRSRPCKSRRSGLHR